MLIENELLKLEQLVKILELIDRCQRYLEGDKKTLRTEACNWLPSLKTNAEKRIAMRTQVITRLRAYYAKKCFQLYLAALQGVEDKQPDTPLKLNSDAGWNPDGVRHNNELLIYGPTGDQNALRA